MKTTDTIKKSALLISLFIYLALTTGCSLNRSALSKDILPDYKMDDAVMLDVNFRRQKPNMCGVVALESVLDFYKIDYADADSVFNEKLNATRLITMVNFANRYIDTDTKRLGYDEIARHIRRGAPVIILRKDDAGNHYSVVKGYIKSERKLIVNDGYDENVMIAYTDDEVVSRTDIAIIFRTDGKHNIKITQKGELIR